MTRCPVRAASIVTLTTSWSRISPTTRVFTSCLRAARSPAAYPQSFPALTWVWDVTTEADKEIIVNNWRGLQSRYYQPGPFSAMERMEKRWVEWFLQELGRRE